MIHPCDSSFNLLFLLSGGGHLDYEGFRQWMIRSPPELFDSVRFVLSLDDLMYLMLSPHQQIIGSPDAASLSPRSRRRSPASLSCLRDRGCSDGHFAADGERDSEHHGGTSLVPA